MPEKNRVWRLARRPKAEITQSLRRSDGPLRRRSPAYFLSEAPLAPLRDFLPVGFAASSMTP